jgi:hypothetical protein
MGEPVPESVVDNKSINFSNVIRLLGQRPYSRGSNMSSPAPYPKENKQK